MRAFNMKNNYHMIYNHLDLLKKIHNNFINLFSTEISNYLNLNNISIKLLEYKISTDCHNIEYINKSIILNVIQVQEFRDPAFLIFSSDFLSMILENLFGGNINRMDFKNDNRKITSTELNIINYVTEIIIKIYKQSIKNFFPIEIKRFECKVTSDCDILLYFKQKIFFISTFHMVIGSFKGIFSIMIPLMDIQKKFLNKKSTGKKDNYDKKIEEKNILKSVYQLHLIATVKLTDIVVSFLDILKLKPGDIIPIDKPDFGILYINNFPIFSGQYKIVNEKYALCVKDMIRSNEK